MSGLVAFLALVYRFKPLRTSAQTLAGLIGTNAVGITEFAWTDSLSVSAMAGVAAFVQIWSEGGDMFGEDKRVTNSVTYVGQRRDENNDGIPDGRQ